LFLFLLDLKFTTPNENNFDDDDFEEGYHTCVDGSATTNKSMMILIVDNLRMPSCFMISLNYNGNIIEI
jgi:hypothetical protein